MSLTKSRRNKSTTKFSKQFKNREGYIFILPLFIFIVTFIFFPVAYSFYISLFHYNPLGHTIYFVGLANYIKVIHTGLFWDSFLNVVKYTLIVVTTQTFFSLGLALLFKDKLKISRLGRTLVFIPAITSPVAMSIIFIWVFSNQGPINLIRAWFGLNFINFFFSTTYAFPAIMAMNIFSTAPYFMVMYISGLQAIPSSIYDAASIDGIKSMFSRFRYIYAPMLSFATVIVVILGLIGSLQLFDQIFVITQGGPANSTYVPLIFIYNKAFLDYGELGIAAASSFILFIFILVATVSQRRYLKDVRWS